MEVLILSSFVYWFINGITQKLQMNYLCVKE